MAKSATGLNLGGKLNWLLAVVFLCGTLICGVALAVDLTYISVDHVASKAQVLLETMNSVRSYTSNQVKPELEARLNSQFLPETVPAFSAREVFEAFRSSREHGEFFYKEATLNPTNLRDKADYFEETLVERFQDEEGLSELKGFRSTPMGKMYYVARPIQVTKASCLQCHSTPEIAPKSMLERYGDANGFGWKLDDIVGTQVVSVPAARTFQAARKSLVSVLGIVAGLFALSMVLLNVWLKRFVVTPLSRMKGVVEEAMKTNEEVDFGKLSNDEIGVLGKAFKRLITSLKIELQRVDDYRHGMRRPGANIGQTLGNSSPNNN